MRQLSPQLRKALLSSLLPLLLLLYLSSSSNSTFTPPSPPDTPLDAVPHVDSSIIIPSFRERPNIRPLVERIFHSVSEPSRTQVVLVDDNSQDGTAQDAASLQAEGYNLLFILRTQDSGLSSAVLRGLSEAEGHKLVVMDADLQHPPEKVQAFLDALSESTPMALGTRYAPGVEMDRDWPVYRKIISWGARMLARPLTSASDPMTGFFAIQKDLFLSCAPLNPGGFKIALELLLKSHPAQGTSIAQVPYSFSKRSVGASKLSSKVMFKYVLQLMALYRWRFPLRSFIVVAVALVGGFWVLFGLLEWLREQLEERQQVRLTKRKGKHIV